MRKNRSKARGNDCSSERRAFGTSMHSNSQYTWLSLGSAVISVLVVLAAITPAMARETKIGTADLDFDSSEVTEAQIQSVETEFSTSTKPGDIGYSFKRFGEWFREVITFNQDDKVRIKIEFARERLAEAKLMADLGNEDEATDLAEEAQEAQLFPWLTRPAHHESSSLPGGQAGAGESQGYSQSEPLLAQTWP